MSTKKIYNCIKKQLEKLPEKMNSIKTNLAEDYAIYSKKGIYSQVTWSDQQQREFDSYWIKHYGKKISNKWHKLYQACSGVFDVEYIPEKLYTTKLEPLLNDSIYARVLEDKAIIEILAHDCGCEVPETLIVCSNGQFYNKRRIPISKNDAVKVLNGQRFLIKPTVDSSSGRGISFFDLTGATDEELARNAIVNKGNDFIAQSVIVPHPVFAEFNNTSINTIRITTYLINDTVQHAPLALRIGRSGKKVDNIHAGGLVVGVSDEGYLLKEAYELGYGNKTIKFSEHPDSHILFSGYRLPCIDAIIKSACKLHGRYPHIGVISWDYTVNSNSTPVLIEANIMGQSVWIVQMIHGKGVFGKDTGTILEQLKRGK